MTGTEQCCDLQVLDFLLIIVFEHPSMVRHALPAKAEEPAFL